MSKRRKQGEGTLRKRADGRWEARVVIGYDEKGNPITKNVTAMEKGECLEKLEQLKEKCGVQLTGKVKAEMAFGDWLDFWYQQYAKQTLRPTTQSGYENMIYNHIITDIGKIPLNKLTQNDLQQFYTRLKNGGRKVRTELYGKGLSDRMVRGCHAMCRKALEKAVADGIIRINPAIGCKLPPKKAKEMQVLTREEMQRFMAQAKADGYFELFLLELCTGMRRGEIVALQWDDLNMQTGELHICRQATTVHGNIHICAPKTKSSIRTVILPPDIVKILAEYKKRINSRWMFPSPVKEDAPYHPSAIRKVLDRTLERAECKHVRFHDLRHTFATTALANGMDVKTLSAIIGHISSETTLNIYTHITDNMQRSAANKIEQGFGRNEGSISENKQTPDQTVKKPQTAKFEPKQPKIRRPGTGCITQINDHLFEGRYSPTNAYGKRTPKNVYAKTREECEEKLTELITQMNAEIAAEKERLKTERSA
ncbi:MAG: site-specific integrase [Acutalibacteraceae bacterium]|nr:site-specific integrase [Acutalibacteraceae bacterium]